MDDIHHVIGLCDFLLPLARTYQLLGQIEKAALTLVKALRLQVDMDLNKYVNDKSIAWIAWTFVICADFHWRDTIRMGTHIIVDEMNWQPKHLRDRCAAILIGSQEQSSEDTSTDSHNLSRKQWVQSVLRNLETRPQVSHAQCMVRASSDLAVDSHGLTARELDVLRALSQGLSNKAIANKLHISESTVRTYLSHVYSKLGVASRTEALIQVRKLGLFDS
jgi:DNA-binding CsgD family transcriptional regulator